jgi:hypothetical protein
MNQNCSKRKRLRLHIQGKDIFSTGETWEAAPRYPFSGLIGNER